MSAPADAARSPAQLAIGVGALVVGGLMAWGAAGISSEAGYAGVGPNFLPWVVSLALVACGAFLVWEAASGGYREMEPPSGAGRADLPAFAWVSAGLLANAALLTTLGFVLACTLCFMLAVRGLRASEGKPHGGARGLVLDFVTGFLVSAPAFWLFTKLLGINLPNITGTTWL
jgi:putative tricarboxylic transport membrane protein